jgi:hypothetical protein
MNAPAHGRHYQVDIAGEPVIVCGDHSHAVLKRFERDRACLIHGMHHILGLNPESLGRVFAAMARSIARDALRGADER